MMNLPYRDENDIRNQGISVTNVNFRPPAYDEISRTHFIHSSNYFMNSQRPSISYIQPNGMQPTTIPNMQCFGIDAVELKYEKLHRIHGVLLIVFGSIIMVQDILQLLLLRYYCPMFPAGLFMIISGSCSIYGIKRNHICTLKAALTFNIFALIYLFVGYLMGIIAAGYPLISINCGDDIKCITDINYIINVIRGLAVFNTIYGIIFFVFVLWDSTVKCKTFCCRNKVAPEIYHPPVFQLRQPNTYTN